MLPVHVTHHDTAPSSPTTRLELFASIRRLHAASTFAASTSAALVRLDSVIPIQDSTPMVHNRPAAPTNTCHGGVSPVAHHTNNVASGSYVTNRSGVPLCQDFQTGACSGGRDGSIKGCGRLRRRWGFLEAAGGY